MINKIIGGLGPDAISRVSSAVVQLVVYFISDWQ